MTKDQKIIRAKVGVLELERAPNDVNRFGIPESADQHWSPRGARFMLKTSRSALSTKLTKPNTEISMMMLKRRVCKFGHLARCPLENKIALLLR
jgi:hypothetical protein